MEADVQRAAAEERKDATRVTDRHIFKTVF